MRYEFFVNFVRLVVVAEHTFGYNRPGVGVAEHAAVFVYARLRERQFVFLGRIISLKRRVEFK